MYSLSKRKTKHTQYVVLENMDGTGFYTFILNICVCGRGLFYFSLAVLAVYLTCRKWVMSVHTKPAKPQLTAVERAAGRDKLVFLIRQ